MFKLFLEHICSCFMASDDEKNLAIQLGPMLWQLICANVKYLVFPNN